MEYIEADWRRKQRDNMRVAIFNGHIYQRVGPLYQEVFMYETVDDEKELITFNLHDFTGRYTGYLQYNWKGEKKRRNDELGRYFSHTTPYQTAVFGLQYHDIMKPELLVCEGVFDALTAIAAGYNAIAILSNTGKRIKNSLDIQGATTIAVCQGDKAGQKLAKLCQRAIYLPEGEDANSMGVEAFKTYFEDMMEITR